MGLVFSLGFVFELEREREMTVLRSRFALTR